MTQKKNILFLCTGNSCRSQMAEGWAKKYWADEFEIYSAGTKKHGMNLRAVQVMQEAGVDLSSQYSKTTEELTQVIFDYIVTVCDNAHENCPYFPGGKIVHVAFPDPPALTSQMSDEDEILPVYRKVRDDIEVFMKELKTYLEK